MSPSQASRHRGVMPGIDPDQARQAPPLVCRRCGAPVYLEVLKDGRKRYVDAVTLEPHRPWCSPRPHARE